jgi:hypothetical protein
MAHIDLTDDWWTGEHQQPRQDPAAARRPKARPASGKQPSTAQAKAIESINERFRSDLNDEIGF